MVRNCGFSETFFFVVCDDIWIAIYPSFVVVRSDIVYASKFRQLAYDVNWGEAALIDQFRCGLRDDIQDLLLTLTDPSSSSEAITQAIRCDNRLFERR